MRGAGSGATHRSHCSAAPDNHENHEDVRNHEEQRIGTSRVVIVTPRHYVVDNTVTLDALRQFGANARGIAVVRPEVTDRELKRLQERGIRGIRFTVASVAQTFVKIAPERVVWGSDWPHPSETEQKPDDALLFDLLATWEPDEKIRNRILVQNPEALYGFASRT